MTKPFKRYNSAYSALYGNPATLAPPKRRSCSGRPKLEATEDQEQIALVNWLDRRFIPFYHVPNGGARHVLEGARFKRMGVRPGVPDICIPRARGNYHGLYVELKRKSGGRLSQHQQYWRATLEKEGYKWVLAFGAEQGMKAVEEYLQEPTSNAKVDTPRS